MKSEFEFERLLSALPLESGSGVNWDALYETPLAPYLRGMSETQQNPEYHGEGDVLTHTKMVCDALLSLSEYKECATEDKKILLLAAILHDIGKIKATKLIDGKLASPHHTSYSANMARELLWRDFSLCGSDEKRNLRESVCALVRYHSFPPYAVKSANPELKMLKIASLGKIHKGFSIEKLCLLERADAIGRIGSDSSDYLERIELCAVLAEDLRCVKKPYSFADDYSERAYYRGKSNWRDSQLYNDSFGEVILMSGLPASGKDTYIANNYSHLPTVCLDDIREKLGILPTENQGEVVRVAHEMAKEYLRKKQPFVWNATSLTPFLRNKQIDLFEQYGASVKTVFIETEWDEELRRNRERPRHVPEPVISSMLARLEPPEPHESCSLEWIIT